MTSDSPANSRTYLLAPLLALGLGAALRFFDLDTESLWLDEALSWQQASLPIGELMRSIAVDVHPPLYALLLHAVISVFGDSEWALRLLSAVCVTASVWLTWAVCRRLHSDFAACIASLLCAISLFAIQYSQEARMYALMNSLALASMLMLLRISSGHPKQSSTNTLDMAGYILATGLLMYSHVYGLFVVIAQNIYMGARYLPGMPPTPALSKKTWLGLQTILAVIFLPWLYVLTAQIARVQSSFWIDRPDIASLVKTFEMYVGVMPALFLAAIAAMWAMFTLLRPGTDTNPGADSMNPRHCALFLAAWLLTPILLPYLISQFLQPIYMPRYTIASSSAWFMLVAIGIASLNYRWLRYGLLSLLLVSMSLALPYYFINNTKTDWPAVVSFVEENAAAGDLVLFHNPDVLVPYRYYATRDDLVLSSVVPAEIWQAAGVTDKTKPDVRGQARRHTQVWLVSGYDLKTAITEIEIVNQLVSVHPSQGGQEFTAIRVFRFAAP